ncbi:PLP-dependent transferase [Collinsella tanakaei]|uniref:PLP-dependent transferase n=1 Tax=Collinsella tanakaei TaxID=626935 RepID=UPI00195C5BFE|nr:PLP-dependent transferase [Collinsella tanakaei]MBM6868084.1 PLP-dependent transferase [Collinsella tanakaei]
MLAREFSRAECARASWFVAARNVPEAIAKLGLIGPSDRLVVRANDFADAFLRSFGSRSLTFAQDVTPEAFRAATWAPVHPAATGSMEPREAGHVSYADGAGARFDRVFWFVNSIGCRGLAVPDLRAVAEAAREAGAMLLVDNTVASSFCCQPLALGAHVVFEALDRVAEGRLFSKAVAISVARDVVGKGRKQHAEPLAHDAYCLLAQRLGGEFSQVRFNVAEDDLERIAQGMETLDARMQRHMDNARVIAEYLAASPFVPRVAYPGLKSHPCHETAARILQHGFGPALDFELPYGVTAGGFLKRCSRSGRSYAAGGPHTRMSALDGDDGHYIRLFAGVDDPLDIVDSLDQAMRLYCNPPHA